MLEKFEKKVIQLKKKLGEKNLGIIFFSIVCIIALGFMLFLKRYKIQKQEVQDGYNKSMYDFVANVNNIENEMLKLRLTTNDTYTMTTLASIFAKANSANSNLDNLPFSSNSISNVSRFLNQLSDFSYSLMRDILNGDNISNYKDNIDTLYEKIESLSSVVEDIYVELNTGSIKWNELEKIGDEKINNSSAEEEVSKVNYIGKTFTEYEGIIYDGAFSNHILTLKPAYLTGNTLTSGEVEDELKKKIDIDDINYKEEQNGRIPLYIYEAKLKNSEAIKIIYATKEDGKVYQMISDRKCSNESITIEDAKTKAMQFINSLGVDNIVPTYYLKADNMVTISFAAIQEDVIIYSDLIKVKVALDNGEIMNFEANGYIYNHKEREINPLKTVEEAKNILYNEINIESEKLCIIPTDSKDEVLVYEFEGTIEDKKFLIYVNADTLVQEKIYILLDTPGGTLAI